MTIYEQMIKPLMVADPEREVLRQKSEQAYEKWLDARKLQLNWESAFIQKAIGLLNLVCYQSPKRDES